MKKNILLCFVFAVAVYDAFAALSAKSYIQEGLVAHWDGIENVSYGAAHDNSATKWTELTGGKLNFSVPSGGQFGDFGLSTVRKSGAKVAADTWKASAAYKAFSANKYTVEFAYEQFAETISGTSGRDAKIPDGYQNQGVLMMLGEDKYWIGTLNNKTLGSTTRKGSGYSLNVTVQPSSVIGKHTLSCSQDGSSCRVAVDERISTSTQTTGAAAAGYAHGLCLNRKGYYNISNGLDCCYHSIRFYNRQLSADETAVNRAIDQVRYFGASANDVSMPDGWRFSVDSGDVRLERWLSAEAKNQVGGTVTVNGNASGVWCEYGATVDVLLNALPYEGYTFIGWMGVEGEGKYSLSTTAAIGDNVTAVFRKSDGTDPVAYSWIGSSSGDWYDPDGWIDADGLKGVPSEGDSVVVPAGTTALLTNSTPDFASFRIAGTLVATNWSTCISAENVEILSGGILKCASAVADERDLSRVWIKCGDLMVNAGGKIDVSSCGYRGGIIKTGGERGYGPGSGYFPGGGSAGTVFTYKAELNAAPSHGGFGAHYLDVNARSVKSALPYDDPIAPELPGSGGFSTSWGAGGNGGGVVLVEADGIVTIDGSVLADGGDNNNDSRAAPGSGGSIRIVCSSIAGSGVISAQGGDGYSKTGANYALPAGGGCISIEYDSEEQESSAVAGMKINAGAGVYGTDVKSRVVEYSDWRTPDPGTLHFTDAKILDQLLGNGLSGSVKGCPIYERDTDLAMEWGYVRFADEAVSVKIDGDLSIAGDGVRLEIGAVAATNRTAIVTMYGGDRASRLSVGGDMTLADASRFDVRAATTNSTEMFGAFVSVGGTLTIGTNAAVYSWCDQIAPSSPFFEVGNLVVSTGGLFSAHRAGGAGGINRNENICYIPGDRISGKGAGFYTSGGGHGGNGGIGSDTSSLWGRAYDDAHRPWLPGSGAGSYNDYSVGGHGGGVIIVSATNGFIRIDGTVSADGENGGWASRSNGFAGGGAGGTILFDCKVFTGSETGLLSAKGGTTNPGLATDGKTVISCGGGGGGRIAVWCGEPWTSEVPNFRIASSTGLLGADKAEWFSYKGSFSVAGGVAEGSYAIERNHGKDGTVFFHHIKAPPRDLILRLR